MDNTTQPVTTKTPKWVKNYLMYLKFVFWSLLIPLIVAALFTIYRILSGEMDLLFLMTGSIAMSPIAIVGVTTLVVRVRLDEIIAKSNLTNENIGNFIGGGTIMIMLIQAALYLASIYIYIAMFLP